MSKVIKALPDREMGHIVQHKNGKTYYIDSCWTPDHGDETMVFIAEKIDGEYETNYKDLHMKLHKNEKEMKEYHAWIIEHLEEVDLEEE